MSNFLYNVDDAKAIAMPQDLGISTETAELIKALPVGANAHMSVLHFQ